ncbi:hypothetical protein ABG79_00237 [Caloramator mitchellensis]|uniref:DUF2357 domain-containing protein n=1 Tax=Caloramator mitchellensis TaxID=908809 RepID=A0A0R3JWY1_CALMK|nr:hypothetical protein [Caloramator mitchellensis]KRQ88070.1 hypothetical protein ABG79_00237 [Caloramator mitchellensis]
MAMHHNFGATVVFTVDNFSNDYKMPLDTFYDSITEIKDRLVEIKESSKVQVKFESIFENSYLEIKNIFSNEGEFVRIAPGETVKLFESDNKYSILLPGDHLIRINIEGKLLYNIYTVQPRHINDLQLQNLREFLNSQIRGLSYNLNTSTKINRTRRNTIQTNYLNIFKGYKKEFKNLFKAMEEILKNPITEIKKTYIKGQNVKKQDAKTIRFSGRRNGGERLEIKKIPTTNSRENQIIKAIILAIYKDLRRIESNLYNLREQLKVEYKIRERELHGRNKDKQRTVPNAIYLNEIKGNLKEIDENINDIRGMLNTLSRQLNTGILGELQISSRIVPLKSILKEPKYNKVYNIYRNLRDLQNYSTPNFKTSDILYEYFVLLNIINSIKDIGFELADSDFKNLFIHHFADRIPEGINAIFVKDNIRIEIWYEKELFTLYTEALNEGGGFYTHALNRLPDIRIDVFVDNKLLKSAIVEVKYRRFSYIWSDTENIETMIQIKNYKNTIKYISSYLEKPINPIEKVVVIYPGQNDIDLLVEKEFGDFSFLQLKPGNTSKEIIGYEELKKLILDIIH